MRRLLIFLMLSLPVSAVTVDRIAATVDRQVLTVSEITQMAAIRFFPRTERSEDDYRRGILDALIAQALRYRDVERFGGQEITPDAIESRFLEIRGRFPSEGEFAAALAQAELTPEEVRALVRRQLQVEAYIRERFAPLVFVSNEEIEEYYRGPWTTQRRERGLSIPSFQSVREEVRMAVRSSRLETEVGKWTAQLRARADVDVYAWR